MRDFIRAVFIVLLFGALAIGLYKFSKDCESRGGVVITDGNGNNRCVAGPPK